MYDDVSIISGVPGMVDMRFRDAQAYMPMSPQQTENNWGRPSNFAAGNISNAYWDPSDPYKLQNEELPMLSGGMNMGPGGYMPPSLPIATTPGFPSYPGGIGGGGGDGLYPGDIGGGNGGNINTPQSTRDYLENRDLYQNVLSGLFGPIGSILGLGMDYNQGFNTFSPNTDENLGFTNPFTGNYREFYNDNYSGPGIQSELGLGPSEQRDMLINQMGYDPYDYPTNEEEGLFGGLKDFLGYGDDKQSLNYDPDLDLGLNRQGENQDLDDWIDWEDPNDFGEDDRDLTPDDFKDNEAWHLYQYNKHLPQFIEEKKEASLESGNLSDWDLLDDYLDETGMLTKEWDPSNPDFSWNQEDEVSDSGGDSWDSFGDSESDMDSDSGWSGADSDFDGWGDDDDGGWSW